MDKVFALFGKLSLGILIAAILIGGGVYLGLKGKGNSSPSTTPTPNSVAQASPSPALASAKPATPSPSLTTNQTVVVNGTDPFVSFSATIPNGWQTKKEIIADRVKVTFSNGSTNLIISQAAGGGGQCIYPGEKPTNFSSEFKDPTNINGPTGLKFKRAEPSQGGIVNGTQNFTVCEERSGDFQFPTEFGYVSYQTALNPTNILLSQLDQIVASLKKQ